jgi:hypothetical protein
LDRLGRREIGLLRFHYDCQAVMDHISILLSQVEISPVYILQAAQLERLERVLGCRKAGRVGDGWSAGPLR